MVTNSRWSQKIVAFLHDPPDKPFAISGHEDRASELLKIVLGRDAELDEQNRAKRADWIASASDRVDFPEKDAQGEYLEAYWHKREAVLTHPLAGRTLDLGVMMDISVHDTHQAALNAAEQLVRDEPDSMTRFLRLWRRLPDAMAETIPDVGELFGMLPAETRQPDHPLHQHQSITAAIADALPQPAFLVFSIGPVQEFIAAARRTQDLWMGSYLLSYLTWAALQSILETYGPDVVVFPSLRGQPLCDLWLRAKSVLMGKPDADKLSLATLPNKFVALLPTAEAKTTAAEAANAVRSEWQRLTDVVRQSLDNDIMPADEVARDLWQKQIHRQLEIYWAVLPWAGADKKEGRERAQAVKAQYEQLCQPTTGWPFGKVYPLFAKPRSEGGGQYHPNWGTTYSLLYALADRAFNSRKSLRDFEATDERGEKCTVCGQLAALHGKDRSRAGVRAFWSQVANNLKEKGRYAEVKPHGRERLCAVCTAKRFVQMEVFQKEFSIRGGFPSTSEVAVAPFKAAVIEKLSDSEHGERLVEALRGHLDQLQQLGFPVTVAKGAIPKLRRLNCQLYNVSPQAKVYAEFLGYDGEAFFVETFTPDRLKDDYGLSVSESDAVAARKSLGKLLRATSEASILHPSKYYAILHMDGDHAGRWISGAHKGLTSFGQVLHPSVCAQLESQAGWTQLLKQPRLITPAIHAAISEALADFALKIARWVIEERYTGRVVYAGGDDVLALLPLDATLVAARELRALFSGEVAFVEEDLRPAQMDLCQRDWKVTFCDPKCTGFLWMDRAPVLTMGPTASASIGIALAHHSQPLDVAVQAARDAEHDAKELYDRNALCVYLLKRSGDEARIGAQWFYQVDDEVVDVTALIDEVRLHFVQGANNEKGLSMKFAHAVFDEARTLAKVDQAQQPELRRLILRHAVGFRREQQEQRKKLAEDLSFRFARLASMLHNHRDMWERDWRKKQKGREPLQADEAFAPQPGIVQLAQWLLLARFMAKGGEE